MALGMVGISAGSLDASAGGGCLQLASSILGLRMRGGVDFDLVSRDGSMGGCSSADGVDNDDPIVDNPDGNPDGLADVVEDGNVPEAMDAGYDLWDFDALEKGEDLLDWFLHPERLSMCVNLFACLAFLGFVCMRTRVLKCFQDVQDEVLYAGCRS